MHFLYETNKWNSPALEFSFYMAHHHIFADGDDWKYITCITSHIIFLWYCKKSTYECHYNWCEQQPKENSFMIRGRITRCWVCKYEMFNISLPHHHYNIPQRRCKNIKKNSLFLHTWKKKHRLNDYLMRAIYHIMLMYFEKNLQFDK